MTLKVKCDPDLRSRLLQTQRMLQKNKRKKIFSRTIETSNLEVIKSMVLAGAGVGILPMRVIDRDHKNVEIFKEFPNFKDRLFLAYRVDAQTSSARKELTTAFRELRRKSQLDSNSWQNLVVLFMYFRAWMLFLYLS